MAAGSTDDGLIIRSTDARSALLAKRRKIPIDILAAVLTEKIGIGDQRFSLIGEMINLVFSSIMGVKRNAQPDAGGVRHGKRASVYSRPRWHMAMTEKALRRIEYVYKESSHEKCPIPYHGQCREATRRIVDGTSRLCHGSEAQRNH